MPSDEEIVPEHDSRPASPGNRLGLPGRATLLQTLRLLSCRIRPWTISLKDDHGDHQGAIDDYDKVIGLAPDTDHNKPMAYFNRGNSKLSLTDRTGACADWQKALELGMDNARERIAEHCAG